MSLRVVPLDLDEANRLVRMWHRHHKPVVGHRFSLGVVDDEGQVHGALIAGRPVARMAGSPRAVLEVSRLVTDGTYNACSILYGAAARTGKAMGFERIQTYILSDDEPGTSLRASGWDFEGVAGGGDWTRTDRVRRQDQPMALKGRWGKPLNESQPDVSMPSDPESPPTLFGEAS